MKLHWTIAVYPQVNNWQSGLSKKYKVTFFFFYLLMSMSEFSLENPITFQKSLTKWLQNGIYMKHYL